MFVLLFWLLFSSHKTFVIHETYQILNDRLAFVLNWRSVLVKVLVFNQKRYFDRLQF